MKDAPPPLIAAAKVEVALEIVVVALPDELTVRSPPLTVNLLVGMVVPMPTLPLAEVHNVLVPTIKPPPIVVVAVVPKKETLPEPEMVPCTLNWAEGVLLAMPT